MQKPKNAKTQSCKNPTMQKPIHANTQKSKHPADPSRGQDRDTTLPICRQGPARRAHEQTAPDHVSAEAAKGGPDELTNAKGVATTHQSKGPRPPTALLGQRAARFPKSTKSWRDRAGSRDKTGRSLALGTHKFHTTFRHGCPACTRCTRTDARPSLVHAGSSN